MRPNNKIAWFVSIMLVVAVLGVYLTFRPENADSYLKRATLRLQWLHQAQFAGFYVAKEKGFYRDVGIDLEIEPGGQQYNSVTLVAAKSDTFGIATADQVLIASARHVPVRAVGIVWDRSLTAFMVKKDSPIQTPKDFEGKTVGMYYGYDCETIYVELIKKFGVDRKKIKEVALQYDLSPFFRDEVNVWPAYAMNQPLDAAKRGVEVRFLTPDKLGIKYYSDSIIVHPETIRKDADLVRRFLEASAKGWEYAFMHRDEATDIVVAIDPHLDRDKQRKMLDILFGYYKKDDSGPTSMFRMDLGVWQSIAGLLTDQGQGTVPNRPSIEDAVDFSFTTPK